MLEKLKNLYIFEGVREDLIKKIIKTSTIKNIEKGIVVVKEGDISNEAYVIIKGIVNVNIKGKNISTIFEGDIFGEIGLVLDEIRTATIISETDLILLVINRETIFKILGKIPDGDYIKTTILNRIIQNIKS